MRQPATRITTSLTKKKTRSWSSSVWSIVFLVLWTGPLNTRWRCWVMSTHDPLLFEWQCCCSHVVIMVAVSSWGWAVIITDKWWWWLIIIAVPYLGVMSIIVQKIAVDVACLVKLYACHISGPWHCLLGTTAVAVLHCCSCHCWLGNCGTLRFKDRKDKDFMLSTANNLKLFFLLDTIVDEQQWGECLFNLLQNNTCWHKTTKIWIGWQQRKEAMVHSRPGGWRFILPAFYYFLPYTCIFTLNEYMLLLGF